MHSPNSSNFSFLDNGSRPLSESSVQFSSNTGPGGDDLSISELSLSSRVFQRPFSLLAHPTQDQEPTTPTHDVSHVLCDAEGEYEVDSEENAEDTEKSRRLAAKLREEKLQSDAFILKKLNASLALFNETLSDTESANEVRLPLPLPPHARLTNRIRFGFTFTYFGFSVSSCTVGADGRSFD